MIVFRKVTEKLKEIINNKTGREYKMSLSQGEVDALFRTGDSPIEEDDYYIFSDREQMYKNSVEIYSYLLKNYEEKFKKTLKKMDYSSLTRTYRLVRHVVLGEKMDEEINVECDLIGSIVTGLKQLNKENNEPKKLIKGEN